MAKSLTIADAQAANIVIVDEKGKGDQAVHDLVVAYQANRRQGSANSKTRGEVKCTNKKMYKQKGTGNARHGDKGAPIFVGGGVAFGPRPRDYSKKVGKTTRRLALRKVLGVRLAEGSVVSVPSFEVASGKTKDFIAAAKDISDVRKTLIVAAQFDEKTYLAGRNAKNILLMTAAEVNIEQMLHADTIVLVEDAFETLAARTA